MQLTERTGVFLVSVLLTHSYGGAAIPHSLHTTFFTMPLDVHIFWYYWYYVCDEHTDMDEIGCNGEIQTCSPEVWVEYLIERGLFQYLFHLSKRNLFASSNKTEKA